MSRGCLAEYLCDEFSVLGFYGYQVIEHAVENTEYLKSILLRDICDLKESYMVDNTILLQQYGAGNWESMWKCRDCTIPVWKRLFKTDKLLSSWDGLSYVTCEMQYELARELNKYGEPNWIHRDQSCNNSNLADTIQGYLSLSNAGSNEYSTVFYVPKNGSAQNMVDEFNKRFVQTKSRYGREIKKLYDVDNYHVFDDEQMDWIRHNCKFEKPILKEGDLLLWCSSLPHAAAPNYDILSCNEVINDRLGMFVSMMPKKKVDCAVLSNRRSLYKLGLTSSHNVKEPLLFPFSNYGEKQKKWPLSLDMKNLCYSLIT